MIRFAAPLALLLASSALSAAAQPASDPAMARANALLAQMSDDEKLALVHGQMPMFIAKRPADVQLSAGIVEASIALAYPTCARPTPVSASRTPGGRTTTR